MSSCQLPSTDQWSVLGSSTTGEDLVLTFANPNSSPSVVSLEAFGLNGPLGVKTHQLTVPAHSTQSVLAGGLFPEETALVLHVRADGQGVATWTQSSAMQGETPKGTTTIPAARPREETLLQGVSIQGTSTLRLFVPPSETPMMLTHMSAELHERGRDFQRPRWRDGYQRGNSRRCPTQWNDR